MPTRSAPPRPIGRPRAGADRVGMAAQDRKSTRLNSSHSQISYAVFCLKKKKYTLQRDNERPEPADKLMYKPGAISVQALNMLVTATLRKSPDNLSWVCQVIAVSRTLFP